MNQDRFEELSRGYPDLRIGIVGDFCLDRYLEIDSRRGETSIETGLPVYNVINVRAQAGAAGTILNNLAALGVGQIYPIGFCGRDAEGYELRRALAAQSGVKLDGFQETNERRTFTYCKPLLLEPGKPPREINRLDIKNWTPTPAVVEEAMVSALRGLAPQLDAIIVLDQVEVPETGGVTRGVLTAVGQLKNRLIIADSRRSLRGWPAVIFKMNAMELKALTGMATKPEFEELKQMAASLARQQDRPMVITLAEQGMISALPDGQVEHAPALPLRGPIDIVGAGDAVTANLAASLAAGATPREAIEVASVAASLVIHQLGTTGTASREAIAQLLAGSEKE